MKHLFSLIILLASLGVVSCNRPRVIPDRTLSDIFHDAMLVNAYIKVSGTSIDSMNIYEPIFDRYGYTAEDVQYTIDNISRRKNARISDIAEMMISDLESQQLYYYRETAKLDTIDQVARRRYTRVIMTDSTRTITKAADSVRLRYYVENLVPGDYKVTGSYLLDSLDKGEGRRYRLYFERKDSTRRELTDAALLMRNEGYISHTQSVAVGDTTTLRLVIDFYHFGDNVEQRKRTVPKISISDIQVTFTPPLEECVERLFNEQTGMRIFSDSLLRMLPIVARSDDHTPQNE